MMAEIYAIVVSNANANFSRKCNFENIGSFIGVQGYGQVEYFG